MILVIQSINIYAMDKRSKDPTLIEQSPVEDLKAEPVRDTTEPKIHSSTYHKQFSNRLKDGTFTEMVKKHITDILKESGIDENTTVVEVGCGAGTLTRALAERAKKVYAFDIDKDLQPVLAETLAGC